MRPTALPVDERSAFPAGFIVVINRVPGLVLRLTG